MPDLCLKSFKGYKEWENNLVSSEIINEYELPNLTINRKDEDTLMLHGIGIYILYMVDTN